MEGYQMSIECVFVEHRVCDSCGYCKQAEDYEPSDADIEQYIEKQMLAEELEADNI